MSQQNVNDWTDKFGNRLEIGQRVAALKGKTLHIGDILWFTAKGVTIASESADGEKETIPILYDFGSTWSNRKGSDVIYIVRGDV